MKNLLKKTALILLALFLVNACSIFGGGKDKSAEEENLEDADEMAEIISDEPAGMSVADDAAVRGAKVSTSREQTVLNELNFEIKKLGAEVKHLASELRDLQAKSTMWSNPLSIYQKEIILDNGSSFLGKIIYQDDKILKVETLIGYLIIERANVVRIVENIPTESLGAGTPLESPQGPAVSTAGPANRVLEPSYIPEPTGAAAMPVSRPSFAPNVVLVGTITETKDNSGNLKLTGQVKNIGGRRADFVKLNFIFRKDWSGNTRTLTSFIKGSYHTFESGIKSDSSLLPGATGVVEQYVPKSFGSFISYSYTVDWEDY